MAEQVRLQGNRHAWIGTAICRGTACSTHAFMGTEIRQGTETIWGTEAIWGTETALCGVGAPGVRRGTDWRRGTRCA